MDKTQILFILNGVLINAAAVLSSGIFLSGYIVFLGGSDIIVGLLNNSGVWASIVALFSFIMYERMEKRKKLLLILHGVSRFMLGSVVFFPLIFDDRTSLLLTVIFVIVGNIIWAVYSVGFTVWLMSSVPKESRNDFIYTRIFWLRISFTVVTLIMGIVLDSFNKSYTGFVVIFSTGLILSLIDLITLANIKEVPYIIEEKTALTKTLFFEPLKADEYKGFLTFVFLFYCSITISSSFTSVYLIRYLQLDYSYISAVNVLSYIFMIVSVRFWKNIEGKYGVKLVFKVTSLFVISQFIIYGFIRKETAYLLFLASVFSGIGNGGFNIAIFTYRYDIMPESNRTLYEAWFGAIYGISTLIGPFIGGWLIKALPEISAFSFDFNRFQIIYLITFAISIVIVLLAFGGPEKLRIMGDAKKSNHEI
jgi:MFS family permease